VWCKQDSKNYAQFEPTIHAPELALVNPQMEKYALYTLVRQFKLSASALKSLKDYTAQVRVFRDAPAEFLRDGYSQTEFWTQLSDSMLSVSQMSAGDMQALKLNSDLLKSTKHLGRGYFREVDLGKLGRLKAQIHSYAINLNYSEPQWLMLETIKNHAQMWTQRGLSPTFWRDVALKVLVGLGLVGHEEEADLREWLQRQSLEYRAVGWARNYQVSHGNIAPRFAKK
jgi:hypothetical protein